MHTLNDECQHQNCSVDFFFIFTFLFSLHSNRLGTIGRKYLYSTIIQQRHRALSSMFDMIFDARVGEKCRKCQFISRSIFLNNDSELLYARKNFEKIQPLPTSERGYFKCLTSDAYSALLHRREQGHFTKHILQLFAILPIPALGEFLSHFRKCCRYKRSTCVRHHQGVFDVVLRVLQEELLQVLLSFKIQRTKYLRFDSTILLSLPCDRGSEMKAACDTVAL